MKKLLIVIVVILAAVFLVVRVLGKRGVKDVAAELKRPAAQAVASQESKIPHVAGPPPAVEPQPKLRIPAEPIKIPESLAVVTGTGAKVDYFTRLNAVHALGKGLSDTEILALFVLLNRKNGEDGLPTDQLNALKNDVVSALKAQTRKPIDLANNLMAMFYDKGHDGVWRDYCVQHLGDFYPKIDNATEQKLARDMFWAATHEIGSSIAGTALIALANNVNQSDITKEAVGTAALRLSDDPTCGELAKITALQICANLGESKVLPIARQIAGSGASVPLRMSAIAAVGTLGDESDRILLEPYAASTDTRLRTAAQSAVKRLGKK